MAELYANVPMGERAGSAWAGNGNAERSQRQRFRGEGGGEGERRSHELFMESIIATPSRLRD